MSVSIPTSVTNIGDNVFLACDRLYGVGIPNSVTSISKKAFEGCPQLPQICYSGSIDEWNEIEGIGDVYIPEYTTINYSSLLIDHNIKTIQARGTCGRDGDNIIWMLTDDGTLLLSGSGEMECYDDDRNNPHPWPQDINNLIISEGITTIGSYAFCGNDFISSVTIPNSVQEIGEGAFNGSYHLSSLTIPNSVTSIGRRAFYDCYELSSVDIPNSVEFIGADAFSGCGKLSSVAIPNSVVEIGGGAFSRCSSLTSVNIPASVRSIGGLAFDECSSLTSISVDPSNRVYCAEDDVLFNKEKTELIYCAEGKAGEYSIPNSVTSIGGWAFHKCSGLTSVTIPNSVTSIGSEAFFRCSNLTSVSIPNSVTSIGRYAFWDCNNLIEDNDGVYYVDNWVVGCQNNVASANIKAGTVGISDAAFNSGGNLTSVTIPNSVIYIGSDAFHACSGLTSVTIPNSVTSIGSSAFGYCSGIASVDIPNSVTSIGDYAFYNCSNIASVDIPNSVTSIGNYAFSGCSGLTSVVIPNSVTSIGRYAFWGCTKLADMTCEAVAEPTTYVSAFQDSQAHNGTLRVPAESVDKYKAAEGWSEWGNIVAIGTPDTGEGQPDTDVSQYDNVVYVNNVEGRPGSQVTLSVQMDNEDPVYGYEFRLHLPEGVTVATETDAYGDTNPMVTLSTDRTSAARHTFESSLNEQGMLTVLCYSIKKYTFTGNSGEVAKIVLNVPDDMEPGDYPIIIKDEAISLEGMTPEIEYIKSTLTVHDIKLGDANGDTNVNVGDITTIAGYILGSPSDNFVFKGADANEDNKVNVGDITTIASMILDGTANNAKARIAMAECAAEFYLDDAVMERGNDVVIPVFVNNTESAFSSFQFDVNMPAGFNMKSVSANADRIKLDCLQYADMGDGVCRVLGYSIKERMVRGTEGALVYLTLSADGAVEDTYDLSISNGVFAKGTNTIETSEVKAVITVADATSISGVSSANQKVTVYDVNGRAVKTGVKASGCLDGLSKGIYIVNGVKVVK